MRGFDSLSISCTASKLSNLRKVRVTKVPCFVTHTLGIIFLASFGYTFMSRSAPKQVDFSEWFQAARFRFSLQEGSFQAFAIPLSIGRGTWTERLNGEWRNPFPRERCMFDVTFERLQEMNFIAVAKLKRSTHKQGRSLTDEKLCILLTEVINSRRVRSTNGREIICN